MANNSVHDQVRILLVDDFEMIRHLLRGGLLNLGFKNIDEADNGDDAIALMKTAVSEGNPYAFVFCDWNMPERDGMSVLKEVRATPELLSLPFVMVTAESAQTKIVEALKAGATDYIVKPISPENLQKKVTRLLADLRPKAS